MYVLLSFNLQTPESSELDPYNMNEHGQHQAKSALQHLMQNAKRRKKQHASPSSTFFPCPAGCGQHVSERDVNAHLDSRCSVLNGSAAAAAAPQSDVLDGCDLNHNKPDIADTTRFQSSSSTESLRKKSSISPATLSDNATTRQTNTQTNQNKSENNAFAHMMKQSAKIFSNESQSIAKHKFHLCQDPITGRITTTWMDGTNNDADSTMKDEIVWSSSVTVKKIKSIALNDVQNSAEEISDNIQNEIEQDATVLELEVSSSIPFRNQQIMQKMSDGKSSKSNFVQRHSRLSVSACNFLDALFYIFESSPTN